MRSGIHRVHNRVAAVVNRNRRTLGRVHRLVQNQHRRAQIGRDFQILVELAIQNAPLAVDDVQMRFVGCAQGIDGEGAAFGIGDFTALFEREQNFGEIFFTLRQAGNSGLNVRAAYVFALTEFQVVQVAGNGLGQTPQLLGSGHLGGISFNQVRGINIEGQYSDHQQQEQQNGFN